MDWTHHSQYNFLPGMPKAPTHEVYFVVKKSGAKDGTKKWDVWTRMGAAWMRGDKRVRCAL
jgi:hypothetical protein